MANGRNSFVMKMDTSGLDAVFDGMEGDLNEAVRPAAQAAAQVLYDDVKKNVQALGRKTGKLDRSIYQKFSPENSKTGVATYHVSWNASKAPHAWLVENGYLQRYEMVIDDSGRFRGPRVRPGMVGKPKPGHNAPQAVKDAYWVTLPTPIQVPAKAFVRRSIDKFPAAYAAAEAEIFRHLNSQWYGGA